jgi:hypothetical protein
MTEAAWSARPASALVLVCLVLPAAPAFAADEILQLSDAKAFYETYLDGPVTQRGGAVVGATVVGVRLAGPAAAFKPEQIRVPLGHGVARPESLCLRMLSRDGRYFARGQYRIAASAADAPRITFNSSYKDKLSAYQAADVAVSFTAGGKTCDERKPGQLFAAALDVAEAPDKLVLQVRAGDARVRAQLGQNNKAIGEAVLCEKRSGPAIGFTHECALALPKPLAIGAYQLSVGETATAGDIAVKTFALILAPAAESK